MKKESLQIQEKARIIPGQTALESSGLNKITGKENPLNKNYTVTEQLVLLMEKLSKKSKEVM